MAAKKKKAKPTVPAASRGLDARRLASTQPPASVETLARRIEEDGGAALAVYRDPLGVALADSRRAADQRRRADAVSARPVRDARGSCRECHRQARSISGSGDRRSRRRRKVLVAERLPPTRRDARARREVDRRARRAGAGGRASDSPAEHGEGAQPARAGARSVASRRGTRGARRSAGARVSRPSSRRRRSSRLDSAISRMAASPAARTTPCSSGATSFSSAKLPNALDHATRARASVCWSSTSW